MTKVKLSISIDEELADILDKQAVKAGVKRSQWIEQAVRDRIVRQPFQAESKRHLDRLMEVLALPEVRKEIAEVLHRQKKNRK